MVSLQKKNLTKYSIPNRWYKKVQKTEIFYDTKHPYTNGLLNSIARLSSSKDQKLTPIEGTPPDLFSPPVGCPFAARCEHCMVICKEQMPPEYVVTDTHKSYCWLMHPDAPKVDLTYKAVKEEVTNG